jgi:DNA-directed RNA polymerase beta' subunit
MIIYAILSVKRNSLELNTLLGGMKGISGFDLFAVPFGEISAVVSDNKRADLITDQANAISFAGVIDTLAQQFTLLPMRFDSVMESTDAIIKMLERNNQKIRQNLQKVENKWEFGLKIFCDSEKLQAELRAKSETNTNASANSALEIEKSVYREYVNKKLKEHRLEEMLLTYIDTVIANITKYLSLLNTINKIKKMTTPANIIDAVFLLEKGKKGELIQVVEDLQSQYPRLKFILTGPWPPYNFVETSIK